MGRYEPYHPIDSVLISLGQIETRTWLMIAAIALLFSGSVLFSVYFLLF